MIVIITGERNVGKTTVVKRTVTELTARGRSVSGFYEASIPDGLALVDVSTGEDVPFATLSEPAGESIRVGRFYVDPAAIQRGIDLASRDADVLVVDEIGTLERDERGFYPIIQEYDPDQHRGALFSVRQGVADFVAERLPTDHVTRIEVTESNRDALPTQLVPELLDVDRNG